MVVATGGPPVAPGGSDTRAARRHDPATGGPPIATTEGQPLEQPLVVGRGPRDRGRTMFSIASKARPYFGAMVLSCALLTAGGVYSALRMPSGVYPEVTF